MGKRAGIIGGAALALAFAGAPAFAADKNEFFRQLDTKDRAEFRDLVTIVHVMERARHEDKPFEQMRAELVVSGVIPESWSYRPDSPVTEGMLAYGICAALSEVKEGEHSIQGGLTMRIFGNSERYALRECVYLKILSPAPQNKYVSGSELLQAVARTMKYRETGNPDTLQYTKEEIEEAEKEEQEQQPIQRERQEQQSQER